MLKTIEYENLQKANQVMFRDFEDIYFKGLNNEFIKPNVDKDHFDVYHIFNILHERRDKLQEYMNKNGTKTEIHCPVSPNRQKAMLGIIDDQITAISEVILTTLSLPISVFHTREDIEYVIEIMNRFKYFL